MAGTDITEDPTAGLDQATVPVPGAQGRVYVKATDDPTELGSVDAGELQNAIAKGYRVVSPEEVDQIQQRRSLTSNWAGKAEAAAEGLFRGVSGGLSDVLISKIASPEELERIRLRGETGYSQAGEAAGLVGGIVGGSTALKGAGAITKGLAATPVGLVTRGAAAAGRGVEGLVAGTSAGTGRQILAKAAGIGAEGALDAAAMTVTQNAGEAALGNEELTTERLLAGVGENAILGLGVGAGLGGLIGSGSAALQGARRLSTKGHLVPDVAKALDDGSSKAMTDLWAKMSAPVSGVEESTLRKAARENWGADFLQKDEMADAFASRNADRLDKVLGLKSMTKDAAAGSLKAQNVARIVKRGEDTIDAAMQQADDFRRATQDVLADTKVAAKELGQAQRELAKLKRAKTPDADEIARLTDEVDNLQSARRVAGEVEERFGAGNARAIRRAAKASDSRIRKALESGDEAEMYVAMENAKRDFDGVAKKSRKAIERGAFDVEARQQLENTLQYSRGEADKLRNFLESTDVWGQAGANQQRRNAALTNVINTGRDFEARTIRRFSEAEAGTYGAAKIRKGDPDKLKRYFKNLDPESFEHGQTLRHLDSEEELLSAMLEGGEVPAARIAEAEDALKAVREMRADMKLAEKKAGNIRAVERMIEDETKSLMGDPALAGALAGGPIGAAIGAGVNMLARPGTMLKKLATVNAMAKKVATVDNTITRTVRKHIRQLQKQKPRSPTDLTPEPPRRNMASRAVASSAAITTFGRTAEERKKKLREKLDRVQQVAAMDPLSRAQMATNALVRNIGDAAPATATIAVRKHMLAVDFLQSKLPPMPQPNPMQPHLNKMILGNADVERLARYVTAIENPLSVLDDWQRGTLTPEAMEAIKSVYPLLYQDIREKVAQELSGTTKPIPYNEQIQLQLLLDVRDQEAISFMQRQSVRFKAEAEKRSGPRPSRSPPDTAQFALTQTEKITQNL